MNLLQNKQKHLETQKDKVAHSTNINKMTLKSKSKQINGEKYVIFPYILRRKNF